ncbi:hypothetical protein D9M72_476650 [compost metagenome]
MEKAFLLSVFDGVFELSNLFQKGGMLYRKHHLPLEFQYDEALQSISPCTFRRYRMQQQLLDERFPKLFEVRLLSKRLSFLFHRLQP